MRPSILPFDLGELPNTEHAWAAGFFDGEGNTTVSTSRRRKDGSVYRQMQLQISQNDRRPLDRFAAAVGTGKVYGPYRWRHGNPYYRWQAVGAAADVVLDVLLPHISEPKREQALRIREEVYGAVDSAV